MDSEGILLKDLCRRIPYGVKASFYGKEEEQECYDEIEGISSDGGIEIGQYILNITDVKPYLFPLSCMTKEQRREFNAISRESIKKHMEGYRKEEDFQPRLFHAVVEIARKQDDWLNRNHFDSLGLIEMGLVNDATDLNIY